jgi:hypothetical protein
MAPPPGSSRAENNNMETPKAGEKRGRMIYAFTMTTAGELTVSDGQEVTIAEDDGKSSHDDPE